MNKLCLFNVTQLCGTCWRRKSSWSQHIVFLE